MALLERARVGQAATGPIIPGPSSVSGRSPRGPFGTSTCTSSSAQAAPERRQREAGRRGRRRRQSHEGRRRWRRRPCRRRTSGQDVPHGRLQREGSEGRGQGPRAPSPVPSQHPLARNPGSHPRQRLLPVWAPLPPRAPRATEPAAAAAATVAPPPQSIGLTGPCVRPPASGSGLTIGVVDESSTHFLGTSFSVGSHSQTGQSTPPRPSHWLGEPTPIGSRCRGFRCSPAIGLCCLLCNALLTYRLRPFPEVTPPTLSTPPRGEVAMFIGRPWSLTHPDWLRQVQGPTLLT